MAKKQALGKGLSALLPDAANFEAAQAGELIRELDMADIRPNPDQPRKIFDRDKLVELAESIRSHGVMQPLLVCEYEGGGWMIVAGERRFRAAELAGLDKLPCIVRNFSGAELAEISLLENIQREDLTPLEEAEAFYALMKEYGYKQEDLSASLGKSRSSIANTLRLLSLAPQEKQALSRGDISTGHARALLSLEDVGLRGKLFALIMKDHLSVRQAEIAAKKIAKGARPRKSAAQRREDILLQDMERILRSELGLKTSLKGTPRRGRLTVDYYSEDDLNGLIEKIVGKLEF